MFTVRFTGYLIYNLIFLWRTKLNLFTAAEMNIYAMLWKHLNDIYKKQTVNLRYSYKVYFTHMMATVRIFSKLEAHVKEWSDMIAMRAILPWHSVFSLNSESRNTGCHGKIAYMAIILPYSFTWEVLRHSINLFIILFRILFVSMKYR